MIHVILSYCCIVALWYFCIVILFSHIVLSYCCVVVLWHCRIVKLFSLSYSSVVLMMFLLIIVMLLSANDLFEEKLSNNSHFITLQIDRQSPNLLSSNYITEAKKGRSITSPNKLWFKHITNNKTTSIYHMNRFLPLLAHY